MGVVVPRDFCPTNEGGCPIRVIVLRGRFPEEVLPLGWGNWPRGSCLMG